MNKPTRDENIIKGRIAETLIELLFEKLGYEVYRFGLENTIPAIRLKLMGSKPRKVKKFIAKMPDLIIRDAKENTIHFIEVKFRASGEFSLKDVDYNLQTEYPYKEAYFIVVSKKHIKCLSYSELLEGKKITSSSRNYLGGVKEFNTKKNIIIDFCQYAIKFFEFV